MAVILDLHWSNPYGMDGCGQQQMADSNSVTFWDQVSTKYKNDPMILFELYNEPHDVSWDALINGGGNFVGMQTMYNKIRGNGANNVVIVGGLNYAFDLSGVANEPVQGTNIMYNTHPYNYGGKQMENWDSGFGYLTATYPVIATEFGDTGSCSATYNTDFIKYANEHSISYTGWGWFVKDCSFPSLISDWNGTPSQQGQPVHDDLQSTSKVPGGTSIPTITSTTVKITTSNPTTASGTTSNPTTASPSSTTGHVGTGKNVTVYSDSVQGGFADGTWADNKNAADSSQHHSGSDSYSWTASNYKGMYFLNEGAFAVSQFKGLEFWVNGGSSGNQHIHFNIVKGDPANKLGPDQDISQYIGGGGIPTNNWIKGYVDFSNFPQDTADGFWFQSTVSGNEGTVYFDDIVLVAYPPAAATNSQSGNGATNSQSGNSATNSQSGNAATNGDGATTSQGTPAPTCTVAQTGEERCQCSQGGACNPGLVCLSGVCVEAGDKIKGAASQSSPFLALAFLGLFALLF
eukprot:Phypoly_transcript_05954.p1 GENE.Phypoly_transcript_05954~~Phypoly_transcript_05954.p1  ORF type:complete len:606 (+),score=104.94 Phypoly_transcript_05954:266-1819(+)